MTPKLLIPALVLLACSACSSYPTASPGSQDFQSPAGYEEWQALRKQAEPGDSLEGLWYPVAGQPDDAYDVLELRGDGTYRRGDYRMFPPAFDPADSTRIGCEVGAFLVVDGRLHFHTQGQDLGPQSRPGYNRIYTQAYTLSEEGLRLEQSAGAPTPLADDPQHQAAIPLHGPTVYSKTPHLEH